jgi:hypothetical protein
MTFGLIPFPALAASLRPVAQTVACDLLIVGGGLAGAATAYEGLLAGRTVCMTDITDWVGGQISSQGTSALDEQTSQRLLLHFPRGYLELRQRIQKHYGTLNPGQCWVSASCFLPRDGHTLLFKMLRQAAKRGKGTLHWFPNTVIKDLERNATGTQITAAIAIQHQPAPGTAPLYSEPLSQTLEDAYRYQNSTRFHKTIWRLLPPTASSRSPSSAQHNSAPSWYVIDASETGEIIALTDVPYRQGIDPRSVTDPSAASATSDPYCLQGYTYTFAMEATPEPQPQSMPPFYAQYQPYYSYELPRLADFNVVFTYRRILNRHQGPLMDWHDIPVPGVGDISMQNWTWGNDYRPGTVQDNLIYNRQQLQATGQLQPNGWLGGLRIDSLRKAEESAQGYYYWLVAGTTDSQLGEGVKQPYPAHRYLSGLDSPMGTVHGLSKYPYMREGRRIIGRPSWIYPQGFAIAEVDISRKDYREPYYQQTLSPRTYFNLRARLAGLDAIALFRGTLPLEQVELRQRATMYPDTVGIGHYAIDFHPCMALSPPELPGNHERPGERQGAGSTYPFQIPLRAMIPQQLDNLLVAGKSIATSHIAAAAYRVHSFEWSVGAAAGTAASLALETGIPPCQWVDQLPSRELELERLQRRLERNRNPITFPDTTIFKSWQNWR